MRIVHATVGIPSSYPELMRDRLGYQRVFCRLLLAEAGLKGCVIDIGCGAGFSEPLEPISGAYAQLDGVDPDAGVAAHPDLTRRWCGRLEDSDVPPAAYDLAYAYTVVEHVRRPRSFLRKVREILKPGGVFWALTPHARHPFAMLSRAVENIGLKGFYRRRLGKSNAGSYGVNEYPAYYRLNSARQVAKAAKGLGFASATFCYIPCLQWDTYFPKPLRWAPRLYDRLLGIRARSLMLILAYRLRAEVGRLPLLSAHDLVRKDDRGEGDRSRFRTRF